MDGVSSVSAPADERVILSPVGAREGTRLLSGAMAMALRKRRTDGSGEKNARTAAAGRAAWLVNVRLRKRCKTVPKETDPLPMRNSRNPWKSSGGSRVLEGCECGARKSVSLRKMEPWPRGPTEWLIGICILGIVAVASEDAGEKVQLAVVTRRPVPGARGRLLDSDEGEEEDERVEYNIAAFGKEYRLQFFKNKKLLRRGFRMEWKQ